MCQSPGQIKWKGVFEKYITSAPERGKSKPNSNITRKQVNATNENHHQ